MWKLLIVLAVSAVVLPWVIVRAANWWDGMEHMDSRAWINYLADKSRIKDKRAKKTRGKYSRAGLCGCGVVAAHQRKREKARDGRESRYLLI